MIMQPDVYLERAVPLTVFLFVLSLGQPGSAGVC